ncbi:hypothetical protein B0H16DRAFT_869536 [Mycena metata]|uniref:Uncharacterized protein n=1 Tax=Mycena metata TaxID=1033252 RepID=A0AAD7N8F9_9AGAR|nr:hypothetical protein B0H16DRAFT_869536 [Mycena metata]
MVNKLVFLSDPVARCSLCRPAMVSLVLFSLANTVLGLALGKSMSTSASTSAATYPSATYCSPPAATSISLTNSAISTQNGAFPPGPMELGLLNAKVDALVDSLCPLPVARKHFLAFKVVS